jgi:hypothetical protein
VLMPVVPGPPCPDRREGNDEQWSSEDSAPNLSLKLGPLALRNHHSDTLLRVALRTGHQGVNAQFARLGALFLRRPSSLNLLQNGVWYRSTSANFVVLKVPLNLVIETGTSTEVVLRVPLSIKRWSHSPVCPCRIASSSPLTGSTDCCRAGKTAGHNGGASRGIGSALSPTQWLTDRMWQVSARRA